MTKTAKTLVKIGVAAAVGAALGALMTTSFAPFTLPLLDLPNGMRASLALWVLFSVYWSIAARDSAPTRSSEAAWSRQLHASIANIALIVLIFPIPGLTRRFLPSSLLLTIAGLTIQAAFIGLAAWARRHLGSNWSREVRIASGHQLVRSGPYRFVRHPIYTAVLGMYVGTCLVSGELHSIVALAMMLAAYWRKIRLEERVLGETFHADHDDYRRHTWALIPGLY